MEKNQMMYELMRWEKHRRKDTDDMCNVDRKRCQNPMTFTMVSDLCPQFYQFNVIAALKKNAQRTWFLTQKKLENVVVFDR